MYRVTNISGDRQNRGAVFVEPMISGRLLKIGRSTVVSEDYYEKHGTTLRTLAQQKALRIERLAHARMASAVAVPVEPDRADEVLEVTEIPAAPAEPVVAAPVIADEPAPSAPEAIVSEEPAVAAESPKKKGKKGKVE